jgi:hypothetical protein
MLKQLDISLAKILGQKPAFGLIDIFAAARGVDGNCP